MFQSRDRVKRQLVGKSLALGLLLAQAAGLLHLALAPHQLCREHGELVEPGPASVSEASGADLDASSAAALRADEGDGTRWAGPSHEHCAVAVQRRESSTASRAVQPALTLAMGGAPSPEPASPPPSRVVGWQVAPKQGPPAA